MKTKHLLFSFFIAAMLCIVGVGNAWAITWTKGNVTITSSGSTLTVSPIAETDGVMGDYDDWDGSGSDKRPYAWSFGLTNIVIEEGVTAIGTSAFQAITNIATVHIPTSLTLFKESAFKGCNGVATIYYAGTPNQWAQIDFETTGDYCYSHPFTTSNATNRSFYFYDQSTKETVDLTFSAGLTQIKPYAFYRANKITDVYIPGTVTTIGTHALDCSITRLYINKSVAPSTGTTAISWKTSGTYIYMRSDATNSYNKQPWINTTSSTTTGAKNLGYSDYNTTRVSCSWKTSGSTYLYLHKVSGTINSTINWSLSEDGTLTFSGSGMIATSYTTTSTGQSTLLPWYRFRRLINKVVIKSSDTPITSISNALNWSTMIEDITVAQTYVPTVNVSGYLLASDANFYAYRMSTDKINVYGDTSSEEDDTWDGTPWNDSRLNVSFTTTFCGDPSALTISNIGTTTATASWTDDRGDSWKYICKTSASAVPTSSEWESAATTASKSVNLTGLTQGTKYKFYLISDCGSVGTSDVITSSEFSTNCEIISSLPWSDNFESGTNNAAPLCWQQVLSNANGWLQVRNSDQYAGSKAAHLFGGKTGVSVITAVLPEFEDDIKELALSFWYKTSVTGNGETFGQPQLGYIIDPSDASTFVAVGVALDQTSSYTQVENFTVPANTPDGAFFAIRFSGGSDNGYVYIDNVTVDEKPACNKPTGVSVTEDSETDEGATITWNANDMTAWVMQVSEGDYASWGDDIEVATNSKTLTGLKAHTLYYVRVKADCGGAGASDWSDNVSFTTLCGTVNVSASTSWNMDFQSLSDNVIPDCWDNSASTTVSSWGDNYIWGTYSRLGERMLRMENQYLDGGVAVINTPEIVIPNDGNSYELTFDYSNMASSSNLVVKISEDGGSFEQKGSYLNDTEHSPASYPGVMNRVTISLADYNNHSIKVQFYAVPKSGTDAEGAMFVDNVSVHKVPTCFTPTDLTFGNLSANSARASWTPAGEETSWRLQYRSAEGSWSAEQTVNTNAYFDITSLSASTEYFVRVKAYCGAEDQSEWSVVGSFTTLCAAASMPYEEEFSSASALPDCWLATPASGTYKWGAYENSGAYAVQLRTGSSGEAELRMPPVSLSEDAILRFEWKNANGANVNIYASIDGGTTKTLLPNDLSGVHADWTTKVFDLSAYTGETVLIFFKSNFTTLNQYAYLDDVKVVERPCDMIFNIQAATITGGATISWGGNVKKLQYKTGSAEWSSVNIASGDYSGPKTISGLTPARTYQVRLLPACSEDEEANYTTPIFFVTKATELIPYENDFESETAGEVPFNWSRVSSSDYPQVSHDSYAYRDGGSFGDQGNSIKFYGVNDQIIVLPEFDEALQDLSISFHYRNRDCTMELGYVASDGVTFTSIATLPNQSGYAEFPYEKALKSISASAANLAIRYSGATGSSSVAYVDNVSVTIPTCAQPESLTLGTVTYNSAVLSWSISELGNETQYQYIKRVANDSDPDWSSATLLGENVREVSLSNLSADTRYEFYLRSYCGESDQSTPLHIEFRTEVQHEVFEDVSSATDNESRLTALNGKTLDITINRPLLRNGDYCTLTLPFDLSASQLAANTCPLRGFIIKELDYSEEIGGVVNVYLTEVSEIEAGKPYFVRYGGDPTDERLTPLVFRSVTISRGTPVDISNTGFTAHGVFNPFALTANDASTLFLSSANKLYYPSADGTMNGFRAYVKVGGAMSAPVRRGAPIRIVEKENTTTGMESVQPSDLSVQKIIRDGQMIIIRENKEYNAFGNRIK